MDDEEEEQILRDNQDLIPLFMLQVDKLIKKQQDEETSEAPDQPTNPETLELQREKDQQLEEFQNLKIWLEEQEEKKEHTLARVK